MNPFLTRRALLAAGLALSLPLLAQAADPVAVAEPWVRPTLAGQGATGGYLKLTAPQALKLVGARSPVAGVVEVHEMKLEAGVMKMRALPFLPLPAGQEVVLKPGGHHLMLMQLKRPLKAGETLPITLLLEDAAGRRQEQTLQAAVRAGAQPDKDGHAGHPHH